MTKLEAKVSGIWHPIEIIGEHKWEHYNNMRAIQVRVLDGTKPFATGRWSTPFAESDEGFVLPGSIRKLEVA